MYNDKVEIDVFFFMEQDLKLEYLEFILCDFLSGYLVSLCFTFLVCPKGC